MSDKENIGFKTPAKELQDRHAEIQKHINLHKMDLQTAKDQTEKFLVENLEEAEKEMKLSKPNMTLINSKMRNINFWSIKFNIYELSLVINKIYEQLNRVEKSVQELKLSK